MNDKNIVAFMSQPSTLKYFKKLVYYVISLVVTMNKMIEAKWARRGVVRRSDYSRVGELMNNVIDQLLFLQDVLNIQVEAVNEYMKKLMMEDFFMRYCYDVMTHGGVIGLRTSLFLLSALVNAMKEISWFVLLCLLTPPRPTEVHVLCPLPRPRPPPRVLCRPFGPGGHAAPSLSHHEHLAVGVRRASDA